MATARINKQIELFKQHQPIVDSDEGIFTDEKIINLFHNAQNKIFREREWTFNRATINKTVQFGYNTYNQNGTLKQEGVGNEPTLVFSPAEANKFDFNNIKRVYINGLFTSFKETEYDQLAYETINQRFTYAVQKDTLFSEDPETIIPPYIQLAFNLGIKNRVEVTLYRKTPDLNTEDPLWGDRFDDLLFNYAASKIDPIERIERQNSNSVDFRAEFLDIIRDMKAFY